jgi:signal transduction histidine kinase
MNEESQDLAQDETEGTSPSGGRANAKAEDRASHLGFVAHEIRNPLSTALWTAELLGRMDATDRAGARGEKLAGMCLRSLQRVRHLVEDHLLTERLDTGLFPVRPEAVSLVDTVVAAEGRRVATDQPIELDVSSDLGVLADRTLLGRMIDALLDAASQGVSTVKVAGRAVGGEVRLTIRGAVPDPRALEDPLKGAASDTRGRTLALPAARRAAVRMGGRLELRGGAIELTLPEAMPERSEEG